MTQEYDGQFVANGKGSNLWFESELFSDSLSPLTNGGTVRKVIVPHVGVLIVPSDLDLDYPLTIHGPDSTATNTNASHETTLTPTTTDSEG